MDIIQTLAQDLDKNPQHVENVVRLLDEGNTIPSSPLPQGAARSHGLTPPCGRWRERLQYLRNLD